MESLPHNADALERSMIEDSPLPRRQMLAALGFGTAALAGGGSAALARQSSTRPSAGAVSPRDPGWDPASGRYVLPALPYAYEALEPHIDAQTMRLHHDIHHAGYVKGLNAALDALAEIRAGTRPADEVKHWSGELAFHGSGHLLHTTFWYCMGPAGGKPSGQMARQIDRDFGSFDAFASQFQAAAGAVEGSGWGLLVFEPLSRRLLVMQAEKHQNLTAWGVVPLVVVDVWEHAYYLKYQNRRKDYIGAFMNIINWDYAERKLQSLLAALGG